MKSQPELNVLEFNRNAWNLQSMEGCRWSTPFDDERIVEAREKGSFDVRLTPNKPVPLDWFPPGFPDVDLLGLASGGGQQIPIFAALGARVTSFDASDVQLEKDETVCERHQLALRVEQGDMADLSCFEDDSFDVIFNPVSNVFARDLAPIWKECARVLRPNGRLLSGFMNPCYFLFDHELLEETGELNVINRLPYSDLADNPHLEDMLEAQVSLEYSHSLEGQIGGQCENGLAVIRFFEDHWDMESTRLDEHFPAMMATCSTPLST